MPSAVPYTPRPFVPDRYEPRGRLGDYARANGRDVAEAMRHQGATSAALWSGIGQNVAGSLRDIAAYPEQQRQAAMLAQRQQREEQAYQAAQAKEQEHAAKAERLKALLAANPGKRPEPQAILEAVGPEDAGAVVDMLDELYPVPKAPEPYTLNPGDVRFGGDNTQVASVPKPEPEKDPKTYQVTVPGPNGQPVTKTFNEEQMAQGVPTYRAPTAAPAQRAPIWVIGPDGEFKDLAGVAPPGSKPSNTREQGRPVTSGDAGRVTDLDTSLDDVSVLRDSISGPGTTGMMAALGAGAPSFVTEWTGWGADAKAKQAMIDRVRQVIGKALEEGVLRKEDEIKYEKILPTIKDPNSLVLSKLQGLDDALKKRRQRHLDSLGSSGYDISKFSEYKPLKGNVTAAPDLQGLRPGAGRRFTEGPFKGQTWSVDEQGKPYKVGG